MPWITGDRLRIADALQLDSRADEPTSVLASLMTTLEARSPSHVSQVQSLLTNIETLQAAEDDISAVGATSGAIKREKVDAEVEIEYFQSSIADPTTNRRDKLRSQRQKIRRWLDPHGYLARYRGVGRAIDGN